MSQEPLNNVANNDNDAISYLQKWNEILFSTKPINQEKARKAIENACNVLNISSIDFLYCPSPNIDTDLLSNLSSSITVTIKSDLELMLSRSIPEIQSGYFNPQIFGGEYSPTRFYNRFRNLCEIVYKNILESFNNVVLWKILTPDFLLTNPWIYDFYISNERVEYDLLVWNTWKDLCIECPYLLVFGNTFIVIERPVELYFDKNLFPHAEGKAAIKFTDGYEIYCNRNIIIPSELGAIFPGDWSPKLILSENISDDDEEFEELIGIMARSIGYKRFCENLPSRKNEFWQRNASFKHITFIDTALDTIIDWHLNHELEMNQININYQKRIGSSDKYNYINTKDLPSIMHKDLSIFYLLYDGRFPLIPGLYSYCVEEALANTIKKQGVSLMPIFHGEVGEIYYVQCSDGTGDISKVYCQIPGMELDNYAECFTSWMMSIAQCYQDDVYSVVVDKFSGNTTIEKDLCKMESIFEKFNPDQITVWKKLHRA
jgi:hypothetical protein